MQGEAFRCAAEKGSIKGGVRNRFERLLEQAVRAEWKGLLDS
jgi:hypothetical protein